MASGCRICVPDRDFLTAPSLDPPLGSIGESYFTAPHSGDVINVVGILYCCVAVGGATADCSGYVAVRQGSQNG